MAKRYFLRLVGFEAGVRNRPPLRVALKEWLREVAGRAALSFGLLNGAKNL